MPLSEDYIKELVASPAFKEAVREYLKENLQVNLTVNNGDDYYQRDNVVNVEVQLSLADDQPENRWSHKINSFSSDSGSVSVKTNDNSNPW